MPGSIDSRELSGDAHVAAEVSADGAIPAVQRKVVEATEGDAAIGMEVLVSPEDFNVRRVLRPRKSREH